MKAVQLLVQSSLPDDLRRDSYDMDAGSLGDLMAEVARHHPDKYEAISKNLSDAGLRASYLQGETLGLEDLKPVVDRDKIFQAMDSEIDLARRDAKDDADFTARRLKIWAHYADDIEKVTMKAALAKGNNLGYSVASGARGKPAQLKMMLTTPGLYTDANDNVIPLFVRHSFGQGLRPHEYLASTYGARKSVLATKRATAKGGFLCLAEGTLVRMADGSVRPIQEIVKGDWVMGCDSSGRIRPTKVTATFSHGVKDTVKIKIPATTGAKKEFSELHCTGDHKFLTKYWTQKNGTETRVVAVEDFKNRTKLLQGSGGDWGNIHYPDAGLLAGLMVGDGWMPACNPGDKSRVVFSCHDPLLLTDIEAPLSRLHMRVSRGGPDGQWRLATTRSGKNPMKQFLLSEGFAGTHAATKGMPVNIWSWDNESVLHFVAGYLATDGCITQGRSEGRYFDYLSFTSISLKLLQELREQLQVRFGIHGANIHEIPPEKRQSGFTSENSTYFWSIGRQDEVLNLLSMLPSIPGIKGRKQRDILARFPTTPRLEPKVYWRRARVENGGRVRCFDIEVDNEDHLFLLANHFVTSNSKQMVQASAPMLVTEKDCGSSNGVDLDIHDRSLKNRVLSREVGGLPPGTVLDRAAITDLKKRGVENLIVRSALTCETGSGICSKCVGKNAEGEFPPIGESVGITAAQSIGEPIAQNALNVKHTGGVGGGAKREYSGFDWINQFLQTPSQFKDKAVVAEADGRVGRIEEAPQGGTYVNIADERYYVAPGFDIEVEEGQEIEAGEPLSAGLINPSDVVRLRGLGEGRRYFSDRLKQMLDDSGMAADRRSTEMLARSAINHINIDELDDPAGYLPDDTVSYNKYLSEYIPPEDTAPAIPSAALGKVLQAPALHYAIGTRVTPSMVKRLEKLEWGEIQVSEQKPRFSPMMTRLQSASSNNPDWLAQQHTSYLKRNLSDAASRGQDTNIESNVHFAPRLAVGQDFGKNIRETGTF